MELFELCEGRDLLFFGFFEQQQQEMGGGLGIIESAVKST
jgi:hypothetical protein